MSKKTWKTSYLKLDISVLQIRSVLRDPTGFLTEIKTKVQQASELLDTIYLKNKVIPMSSEPPELFGLVKVHKDDLPVRPVASFSKAPSSRRIIVKESNQYHYHSNITKSGDGTIVGNPQSIADMLRDHFNIPAVPHGCAVVGCGTGIPTLFLHTVDENELRSVIDNLPNKYSARLDEIPIVILKHVSTCMSMPFVDIINICFGSGSFRSKQKMEKLIPVHKNGKSRT
ncbi:hypothetical protein WA026_015723 [Henosepilachna vigintioctopunctata]|uniref:Uncharacterized protein n=1 Tax=Henosepilachna vigintioctopunctata TaxID=420089 RepID=A0AAW1USS7_9CUCU